MKNTILVFAATGCFAIGPFESLSEAVDYGETNLGDNVNPDQNVSWVPVRYLDINAIDNISDVITTSKTNDNADTGGALTAESGAGTAGAAAA